MADEMFTVMQAAMYLGVSPVDIRLMIRHGELRAWTLPMQRGLLVRRSDLEQFRRDGVRMPLFYDDQK